MKNFLYIIAVLIITTSASLILKGISWDKTNYDFGDIKQGEIVKTTFTCYNNSDTSLIFENIQASCGCVVPDWSHKPIPKGDSSKIQVVFNTTGKSKQHTKVISVYSSQGLFELEIKANILRP